MVSSRRSSGYLLLAGSAIVTAVVYLGLVPQSVLAGDETRALRYLVVGWVPYTLVFYTVGRLFSTPAELPTMRAADAGLALFLLLLLLSLGIDAWGFSPELVPEAHALQAIGIFVGLALFGWGIGRRSRAIATTARAEP